MFRINRPNHATLRDDAGDQFGRGDVERRVIDRDIARRSQLAEAARQFLRRTLFDRWTVKITAEDNPGRVAAAAPALEGLTDLQVFVEYDFKYRTAG